MSTEIESVGGAVPPVPPPTLFLGTTDLENAMSDVVSAIRQLQAVQEVEWTSAAASLFRQRLYGVIQMARETHRYLCDADDDWAELQRVARAHGQ